MAMTYRDNYLAAVGFRYPEWIPCSIGFSPLTWHTLRRDLERLILAHPRIFPTYDPANANFYDEMPLVYREGEYYRDNWGCLWYNQQAGLEGQVVGHPLADWASLDVYQMPNPLVDNERGTEQKDWAKAAENIAKARREGFVASGGGERLVDRLYFLRGFENLMMDLAEGRAELIRLIAALEDYERRLIQRWLELGVDMISFHTDIGTQHGPMLGPATFRKYLKPTFQRLFQACRQQGVHVYLSSDGNILPLIDDLIECGVSVHDPQLRACTVEGIRRVYRGRLCANVDLDRQGFPFMTPAQIRDQVKQVVDALALPEGGLMVMAAIYGADVPLHNIAALCEAMEEYCFPSR